MMLTLLEVIQKTAEFFEKKGIESARLNAELLIGHALGLKRMQLYLQFERMLTEAELERIRPLVKRRGQREPLQYVTGEVEWSGLRLKVDRRALIPRPETELLVEMLESAVTQAPASILDLGTGSGAIALALAARHAEARVVAVDRSEEALSLARENAETAGLAGRIEFVQSDWFDALPCGEVYALIVSNPPYLTRAETDAAEPEVRGHEPISALVADDAGMADLKTIIRGAVGRLAPGGLLAMETGIDQHAALRVELEAAGFARIESRQDLTGRDRFVLAWRDGVAAPPPSASV